ncbi:MAG TPA: general secretion pathway protein GspD, partial [Flavobacteriales bacterium]|nr:general secretion pathway protein GspD [Flavobacteriales bacterium]
TDNFYYFENVESVRSTSSSSRRSNGKSQGNKGTGQLDISVRDDAFITVSAKDVPIADLIAGVSAELFKQYFIFSDPEGTTSLYIENATYEDFLSYVLNGTNFTFKSDDGVYLIGERKLERLRTTELVQLQYRTVESVLEFIPPELKKDVNIQEFTDLNSLILSGSHPKIREIKSFLKDVDKLVPVVMIEVIIIDVRNTVSLATGIKAGLGESPVETSGTVFPGLDVTLSSAAINKVIDGINGFGIVNLGKVTPIFYLTLQALETQGSINVRSTPQLATLNGHEANMSIGETRFYLETSTTLQGSVSTTSTVSQTYKSVNADLSIKINPIVSGDEQVTLEIDVKQSSFGERISNEAPYGTITRNFQSLIRVKNEEMIILGGLEDKTISDSGSGVPLLSRIPIIKWFFSSRSKSTSKNKLTIFIKPTIIY